MNRFTWERRVLRKYYARRSGEEHNKQINMSTTTITIYSINDFLLTCNFGTRKIKTYAPIYDAPT